MYSGGANHPHPASQECWARAWLITGSSRVQMWTADESTAKTRVAIGSSAACDWPIEAPSLAPVHAELYWDGQALWAGSAAGARIDGRPLEDWVQVSGRVSLDMGGATIAIETSDADAQTQVATTSQLQAMGQAQAAAGRIGQTGLGPRAPTPSAGMASLGPALGAPSNGEATVIVSELTPGKGIMPGLLPPRAPAPPLPGVAAPTPPTGGFDSPFPPSHTPSQFSMPPRGGKRTGGKTSVPPRTWALIGATCIALTGVLLMGDEEPAAKAKPAAASTSKGKKAAAKPASADDSAPAAGDDKGFQAASAAGGTAADAVLSAEAADEPDAPVEPVPEAETTAAAKQPTTTAGETPGAKAEAEPGDGSKELMASEDEAAKLLVEGRYEEAVALYSELAALHPERTVFRTTERILKRKIKERCAATRSCR